MLAIVYVSAFVVAAWAPFAYHHRAVHGVVNPTHLALTLFNAINLLICLWENALYLHVKKIRKKYLAMKRTLGHGTFPPKLCLFEDVSLRDALTYEHWGIVWATYSLLDPSYSDQTSFGFWIDSGNGVVTMIPTLMLSVGATWAIPGVDAQALGVVGIVFNYQMLYGTVLYFGNYLKNQYYRGTSAAYVGLVVAMNAIWIVFPAAWMWMCWGMIRTGSLDALR